MLDAEHDLRDYAEDLTKISLSTPIWFQLPDQDFSKEIPFLEIVEKTVDAKQFRIIFNDRYRVAYISFKKSCDTAALIPRTTLGTYEVGMMCECGAIFDVYFLIRVWQWDWYPSTKVIIDEVLSLSNAQNQIVPHMYSVTNCGHR